MDDDDRGRDRIEFRHVHSPHRSPRRSPSRNREKEEIIIRENDKRRPNEASREVIIRKEESSSPESSREPSIVRKPPILQEVITHHRHIDSKLNHYHLQRIKLRGKGYEVIPPVRRDSPEAESVADEVDVIDIKRR